MLHLSIPTNFYIRRVVKRLIKQLNKQLNQLIGKQNWYSRLKTIRALQNRKPLIYILSGLAFYFLYRQILNTKPFLDFSRRLVQYNIRLIKSSTRDYKAALLYNLQQDQVIKAFQYISVFLEKQIYIRQSISTKIVELKGVSKDQI